MKQKRGVFCMLTLLLLLPALLLPAGANSAPTHWEGSPGSEVLAVEENCPITVTAEQLTFDIGGEDLYSEAARVTAVYQMYNPTEERRTVQMAFALKEAAGSFDPDSVSVTADGVEVPFRVCLGDVIYQSFTPTAFDPEAEGTVYTFRRDPAAEELVVRFTPAPGQQIFADTTRANRYDTRDETGYTIGSGETDGRITFFVFDGTLDCRVQGAGETSEERMTFARYFESYLKERGYRDYYDDNWNNLLEQGYLSLNQLWTDHDCVLSDWVDQAWLAGDTIQLVYTVDFPAQSQVEVAVSYQATSEGLRDGTRYWRQTFTYLLSPARHWADFGTLDVTVITTEDYPYIIDSSLPLEADGDFRYTAHLDGLPEENLTFTLYPTPNITLADRAYARMNSLTYLLAFFWWLILIVVVVVILIVCFLVRRVRKKRRK